MSIQTPPLKFLLSCEGAVTSRPVHLRHLHWAGVPPDKLAGFTAAIPIGMLAAPDEGAPAVGSCQYSGWLDRQYRAAGRRQHADIAGSPARQGICGRSGEREYSSSDGCRLVE